MARFLFLAAVLLALSHPSLAQNYCNLPAPTCQQVITNDYVKAAVVINEPLGLKTALASKVESFFTPSAAYYWCCDQCAKRGKRCQSYYVAKGDGNRYTCQMFTADQCSNPAAPSLLQPSESAAAFLAASAAPAGPAASPAYSAPPPTSSASICPAGWGQLADQDGAPCSVLHGAAGKDVAAKAGVKNAVLLSGDAWTTQLLPAPGAPAVQLTAEDCCNYAMEANGSPQWGATFYYTWTAASPDSTTGTCKVFDSSECQQNRGPLFLNAPGSGSFSYYRTLTPPE